MRGPLKNQNGTSLVSVIVGAGVMAAVTAILAAVTVINQENIAETRAQADIQQFFNNFQSHIGKHDMCTGNLKGERFKKPLWQGQLNVDLGKVIKHKKGLRGLAYFQENAAQDGYDNVGDMTMLAMINRNTQQDYNTGRGIYGSVRLKDLRLVRGERIETSPGSASYLSKIVLRFDRRRSPSSEDTTPNLRANKQYYRSLDVVVRTDEDGDDIQECHPKQASQTDSTAQCKAAYGGTGVLGLDGKCTGSELDRVCLKSDWGVRTAKCPGSMVTSSLVGSCSWEAKDGSLLMNEDKNDDGEKKIFDFGPGQETSTATPGGPQVVQPESTINTCECHFRDDIVDPNNYRCTVCCEN